MAAKAWILLQLPNKGLIKQRQSKVQVRRAQAFLSREEKEGEKADSKLEWLKVSI